MPSRFFNGTVVRMKKEYVPTIGLEIHAELRTKTKMFCNSKNDADETRPNVNICPVCLAHPGTLPVINREAVKLVLRVGTALNGKLANYTEFDRKNYFYPDLPKGYQISQYEHPLVSGGELAGVVLTRIHLEEDTASSVHDEASDATLIDYNRAGVPLMELVTEPVIGSAEDAGRFARELQTLLRYLGASNANMEKGEMRVEANISISTKENKEHKKWGTKVEVKNLNSFRTVERAILYEIKRQSEILESGEKVMQETRGWDEGKQATFAQRVKEASADYRYFPDPDLPSLLLSEIPEYAADALKSSIPELPEERRSRYLSLGLKPDDADMFVKEPAIGDFMDEVSRVYEGKVEPIQLAANYIANDLMKIIRDINERESDIQSEIPISARYLKKIIDMVYSSKISSRSAKDMLIIFARGEKSDPEEYASKNKLIKSKDTGNVSEVLQKVLQDNPAVVADYRKGKEAALEYLVGQSMKALKGAADPVVLRNDIKKALLG